MFYAYCMTNTYKTCAMGRGNNLEELINSIVAYKDNPTFPFRNDYYYYINDSNHHLIWDSMCIGEIQNIKKGDIVKCIAGKYKVRSVEIMDIDPNYTPNLCTCRVLYNDKLVQLFTSELQHVYDFDREMLAIWEE